MNEWQTTLRQRIEQRQADDLVYGPIIAQCECCLSRSRVRDRGFNVLPDVDKHLATLLRDSQQRNNAWLKSSGDADAGKGSEGKTPSLMAGLAEGSPQRQVSQLRAQISNLYRLQSQSTNRQLSLTDTLREKDDTIHQLGAQLQASQTSLSRLEAKEKEHADRSRLQNEQIQRLHDELLATNLELSLQVDRNKALEGDNASLLQRWIDKMNDSAERMNEQFEQEQGKVKTQPSDSIKNPEP
ncbi:hypothetical protein QFC19_008844 [Naganishia cerealis]|uniref:Uncharacterized protein n=1 Tax=Naganishia cerealis TaxID=610337 RepID=A0ACC2UZG2_9TREE|nr:hypothetical protein QFC19_008844 [Naganishia cerealis]